MTANAAERLIQHYVDNFRRLPWRAAPGTAAPDPYRTWLSEVMLQQTTVAAVTPRFDRFVSRWPTIEALAAAPEHEVLSEWAGLGYYARARNLVSCAREVADQGGFPRTAAELRKLPGIGDYTAAAVAAIAFGEPAPAVDTNVMRVISRLYGLERPVRADVERRMLTLMADQRPGDFVQALIDLGATVCQPREPRCTDCPLKRECKAFESGSPAAFPAKAARKARPRKYGAAYWIERDGSVWLVRRPARGLLGGMAALPGGEWTDEPPMGQNALGTVRHIFTHFSLELELVPRSDTIGEGWWQPIDQLETAGLPTLYRRAAALGRAASQSAKRPAAAA